MTRRQDDGSSGLPPINGQADPRWNIYSPPGKGHRNIFTPTLPQLVPSQGSLPSPRRQYHVISTPCLPEVAPHKQDRVVRSPRYQEVAMKPTNLPDIQGNRQFEFNQARLLDHGFIEEPMEWKLEREAVQDFIQHRHSHLARHVEVPPPAPHNYPVNMEAARNLAARRVHNNYVNEVRMETSHHFQSSYSEEELYEIELDHHRRLLLERKDCQAEISRLMKANNLELEDIEGKHVPAPPSCPKPSGTRARKVRKISKKKDGNKENKEF